MTVLNSNALCTRLEVKNFLNINASDNISDNLIHDLINRMSVVFENYCGRNICPSAAYVEYYDGQGSSYLFLKNTPILSVNYIYDDSAWLWGSNTLINSSEYRIVNDNHIVYKGRFSDASQNIKISYNAGYNTPPLDIKQACIEEVSRLFKRRNERDIQVLSKEDGSITYITDDFIPFTKSILDKYRNIGIL